jgi:hypothetical protein
MTVGMAMILTAVLIVVSVIVFSIAAMVREFWNEGRMADVFGASAVGVVILLLLVGYCLVRMGY